MSACVRASWCERGAPGGDDLFSCGDLITVMTRINLAELGVAVLTGRGMMRCAFDTESDQ